MISAMRPMITDMTFMSASPSRPYSTVAAIIPKRLYLIIKKEVFTLPQPISISQPIS
jgi:hypothetical protein